MSIFLRNVIGEYMETLGEMDSKVVVVNADLAGTCRTRGFANAFPDRSFNVGIAEQNMVSFAAGLAHEGYVTYAFSMAPFLSMRACEQCRTDVAYANLNVRLIGVYAGVSGGISGATHWGLEDCAIMCAMPGMTVLEISDPLQAKQLLYASLNHDGPIYIRCSVEPVEEIYDADSSFPIGGSAVVKEGNDGTFLCSGLMVPYALDASEQIRRQRGYNIGVIDMYSLKPIDRKAVLHAAETGNLITVQDHNIYGGLGQIVGTVLAEEKLAVNYKILGIPDRFDAMAHAPYLYHMYKMDVEGLVEEMTNMMNSHEKDSN